ncbi:MAG TPA: hypothetical protein VIK80_03610 [Flavihumibacter sp.]|jgi:hypothetical protein
MKCSPIILGAILTLAACNQADKNRPDISSIKVDTRFERFDQAYFALDSNNLSEGMKTLVQKFPQFTNDFTMHILGAGPVQENNELLNTANRQFFTTYYSVYESLKNDFKDLSREEKELNTAYRYIRYYFPDYPLPRPIAYLGPFDAPGVALTDSAVAIGLQLYGGKDFPFYTSLQGQELFPAYISRRFEKAYIPVNVVKAIIDDIFPNQAASLPLLERMVEEGKYWWLAKQILPDTPDSLITGYTKNQLAFCKDNEGLIWNYFLQSEQLYTTDPSISKLYVGEAPGTQGLPPAAPGNIGQWVGMRIVEKYVSRQEGGIHPRKLMQTSAREILDIAKYKPR